VILALVLDGGHRGSRKESWIRLAASIDSDWLSLAEADELIFDSATEAVVSRRVWRYAELVFRSGPARERVDPTSLGAVLAEAAAGRDLGELLSIDEEAEALLGRIATLRAVLPDLDLPDFGDLAGLLPALCSGRRSLAQLRKAPLTPGILDSLTWGQRRTLDEQLPERLEIPSGRSVRLKYSRTGGPPILAARIQQLFGMKETPRLAQGRLPVLVHLLAPNGRPAQVTMDLASFWANTWQEVRKDLRGRYPKHSWPEDPSEAIPEDRPRRKRGKGR
jgi:ATP-dependent helicase HrpB